MCNGNGLEALTLRALLALYISTTLQVGGEVLTAGDLRVRLEVLALLALLALLVQKYKYLTAGDLRVRLEVLALLVLLVQKKKY